MISYAAWNCARCMYVEIYKRVQYEAGKVTDEPEIYSRPAITNGVSVQVADQW